jgi:hypothetical protein
MGSTRGAVACRYCCRPRCSLGLLHVLQSFNRTGSPLWMSAQDNASTPNYVFGAGDVMSFLDAKLLGAPLAASISSTPAQLAAYTATSPAGTWRSWPSR